MAQAARMLRDILGFFSECRYCVSKYLSMQSFSRRVSLVLLQPIVFIMQKYYVDTYTLKLGGIILPALKIDLTAFNSREEILS